MRATTFFQFLTRVNQFRRVERKNIELATVAKHVTHPGEGVGLDKVDFRLIQVGIGLCQLQRVFVEFDSGDFSSVADSFSLDREAAGVAADVGHRFAFAELCEFQAVLTLVAEETRFVTFVKVNAKPCPVFVNCGCARQVGRADDGGRKPFLSFALWTRFDDPVFRPADRGEPFGNRLGSLKHRQRVRFERQHVVVPVDNDPRQEVSFGMDEPTCGCGFAQFQRLVTKSDGAFQKFVPELVVGRFGSPPNETQSDAGR